MTGVIKFFDKVKGYGFILPADGGKDVFFHQDALQDVRQVSTGHEVEYAMFPTFPKDMPRAFSVRILSGVSYSPIPSGGSNGNSKVREMRKGTSYASDF